MICTVHNILETLQNPEGRFRTLQGLAPDTTRSPEPLFSCSGAMAVFHVNVDGKPYALKCFLNPPAAWPRLLHRISEHLAKRREPWLVEYRYLAAEMLVFDDRDACHSVDVILMGRPEGIRLDALLADAACSRDVRAVEGLARVFCRTASQLLASDVVHGNLKPSNILVTPDGNLKFLNYEYMQLSGLPGADPDRDNIAVANLALGLKVLSADPAAFRLLNGNSMFRLPVLRSSLLPLFGELAGISDCEPMSRLVEMLVAGNYTLRDKPALIAALEALAADPAELDADLARKLFARLPNTELSAFSGKYDWTGPLSMGLCCVEREGFWGYVDAAGEEAIPLRYDWADDFHDGRAVVCLGGEFALIDKEGAEILPAIYESVDWNAEYGLALAALDGKIGLFDRDGRELVPFTYDWVGSVGPLILVRKEGLCGYIRPDGETAIPLQFEDAFDFGPDATALVISAGRTYHIDPTGEEVREKEKVLA